MISLPVKFQEANKQSEKMADVLVAVEDVTLFAEKTTEADWGNNVSESNVDYTPTPPSSGDVELTLITALDTWDTKTSGASSRWGQTTNIYSGKMYLIGGNNGGTYYNDVWEYTISTDTWAQLFPTGGPPTKRWNHSAILSGVDIYVFGGAASGTRLNDIWKYNITGNTWTQLFPTGGPPVKRLSHSAVLYNGYIYIYGGEVTVSGTTLKDLWKYNIVGNTWTQLTDSIKIGRHSAVVYNGKMYVYGGDDGVGSILDDLREYDFGTQVWTTKTSGATDRYGHTAVTHNDRMYVHGGTDGIVSLKDTYEYNISIDSWTPLSDGPAIRHNHSASIDNGKMYVFGGFRSSGNTNDLRKYYVTPEYQPTGHIKTDNIDIGKVPTNQGEWALEDVQPGDAALVYTAWYSTTGAFAGEEVSIGVIVDGQAITDLKRYWRVHVAFAASTGNHDTPILQSIKADYTTFRKFNKVKDLGYEPLVDNVSSLTSKVDFFKPSSIGKISVQIVMTPATSIWVDSDTLFNKIVRVKLGYVYPGLVESDYIHYFTGAIDDWDVDDGVLNLQLKDLQKDWKLPVPEKWESVGDDVAYTGRHHIDIMLDIFQNEINVRDSGLLLDSFATVKAATPGYQVTRTITGKVEDAKKLVEELRVLLFAFFLPRGDGKIGIKLFDKTEATVASFNDDNTVSIKWRANSESLINRTRLYFNHTGAGNDEEDFTELDENDNTTSQTDFRVIRPHSLKDKWTRAAEVAQITALGVDILDQFDGMPSIVDIETDVRDIAVEAGDQVLVTTKEAPGGTGEGIAGVRFLITSKNLDFEGSSISFEALRVAV